MQEAAIETGRAVGDVLAAPETDPAERIVEIAGVRPLSYGEDLRSVLPAR